MKGAVTGVFSSSGRFIAEGLLARGWEVVALGRRRPAPAESLAGRVAFSPLLLDDEEALVTALSGCEVLFNTYWVRFEHGGATFAKAIERSGRLFDAASGARVRRIVHLSVSNASADSPFPYFRGKAAVEDALRRLLVSGTDSVYPTRNGPPGSLPNNDNLARDACQLGLVSDWERRADD
jgi:uncharacterized protein YbjT (DUF2867 family)